MSEKPINGYHIAVKNYSDDSDIHYIGPYSTWKRMGQGDAGANRNLNHEKYYTDPTWFGPDPQPMDYDA